MTNYTTPDGVKFTVDADRAPDAARIAERIAYLSGSMWAPRYDY